MWCSRPAQRVKQFEELCLSHSVFVEPATGAMMQDPECLCAQESARGPWRTLKLCGYVVRTPADHLRVATPPSDPIHWPADLRGLIIKSRMDSALGVRVSVSNCGCTQPWGQSTFVSRAGPVTLASVLLCNPVGSYTVDNRSLSLSLSVSAPRNGSERSRGISNMQLSRRAREPRKGGGLRSRPQPDLASQASAIPALLKCDPPSVESVPADAAAA